jgi:HTH-type transcriptional regulator/antitoxin HipB
MIVNSAAEFGALVRTERKKKGWSQKDLASQAGVSALWVSQVERGKPTAHIGLILRTLKTLDVHLSAKTVSDMRPRAEEIDLDALVQPEFPTE